MKTSIFKSLYVQVLTAIAIGILLGHFYPELGAQMKPFGDAFVKLMKNGDRCLFRPILPEDEPQLLAFIAQVTKEDLYYRYFSEINEFTHDDLANMTQIDYDREMAFVAVRTSAEKSEILGVTRAISDPDNIDAEFAVLVRSDLKGLGLGRRLLEKLIAYTQSHGLQRLNGITMPNNRGMIGLARKLGFTVDIQLEDGIVSLSLPLNQG